MDQHMVEQITNILKESSVQGDMKSRATAFSCMKGILENGQPALSQIRDLDEILDIWKSFEKNR